VNADSLIPVMLLILFGTSLGTGITIAVFAVRWARSHRSLRQPAPGPTHWNVRLPSLNPTHGVERPEAWLAVRGRSVVSVQEALGLQNLKRCSWSEGLGEKLFIAPPVRGWIVVTGSGLPDPAEDIDVCFRFVTGLSRRLGHVQFFSANRVLKNHAWVQAERGRVLRGYAWAGHTLWKQGLRTPAECSLDLTCFEYGYPNEPTTLSQAEAVSANLDKIPFLAARWSLDPGSIDESFLEREPGIAGEPSRGFPG
jgi:hypothetical protein